MAHPATPLPGLPRARLPQQTLHHSMRKMVELVDTGISGGERAGRRRLRQ